MFANSPKKTITVLAAAAALVATAPSAHAGEDTPDRPHCKMHLKKKYRQSVVLTKGILTKVTCDGPATFIVGLDFEDRNTGEWITQHYADGDPGSEAHIGKPRTVKRAGTVSVRMKFLPRAFEMARLFPRIEMHIGIGVEDHRGRFVGGPKDQTISYLVR